MSFKILFFESTVSDNHLFEYCCDLISLADATRIKVDVNKIKYTVEKKARSEIMCKSTIKQFRFGQ